MVKSRLLAAVGIVAVGGVLVAQTPASPSFDVASVKQNKSGDNGGRLGGPPSRFTATNVPLRQFIIFAYQLQGFQIEGGPNWITTDRFDVSAKAEGTFPPLPPPGGSPGTTQLMMRALLADRFKLVTHNETKEMPIYALVIAKPDKSLGPQLHRSDVDCAALVAAIRNGAPPPPPPSTTTISPCGIVNLGGSIVGGTEPMAQLTTILSQTLQRVVVDRTGLSGNFDFIVTFAPDRSPQNRVGDPDVPPIDSNAPSLVTALQEQLGLKLEATQGPVNVLVIDHVERPTPD